MLSITSQVSTKGSEQPPRRRRIAIVHDWLPLYGGAERVLEQIIKIYPEANLFSMIDAIPEKERGFLNGKHVTTSVIQKLPFGKKRYRWYLPLMPYAVEQFDLSSYDLVISSSYAVAKGVLTGPNQLHICYCHSPIRYGWDLQHEYLAETGLDRGMKGWLSRWLLHYVRLWDTRTANGVDHFIANSRYIARRIRKVYRRSARVIHPPVNTDAFAIEPNKENYYLTAARFVPYKKVALVVEAFSRMPDRELRVIGDGPERDRVCAKATPNVKILGYQPSEKLMGHMQRARAFVFAAQEDFGVLPVEAQACGTPVIAYGKGGATETVIHGTTGILFNSQTVESICEAVQQFERQSFDPVRIRAHAEKFSIEQFRSRFSAFVEQAWVDFCDELDADEESAVDELWPDGIGAKPRVVPNAPPQ